MTDATRSAVAEALAIIGGNYLSPAQHDAAVQTVTMAARLWLAGPSVTEEMVELGAEALFNELGLGIKNTERYRTVARICLEAAFLRKEVMPTGLTIEDIHRARAVLAETGEGQ